MGANTQRTTRKKIMKFFLGEVCCHLPPPDGQSCSPAPPANATARQEGQDHEVRPEGVYIPVANNKLYPCNGTEGEKPEEGKGAGA